MAWAITRIRSGWRSASARVIAARSGAPAIATSSKPESPVSIEASAFCRLS